MARARTTDPRALLALARTGDRPALARLISLVEQGGEPARAVGRETYPLGGAAYTIGITGAPGAGKSTLTSALVAELRKTGDEVGVLAIDPSSPFTGGAILGDRVRMGDHALDDGVFIRSMATRGHLGGLALATREAVRVLDAVGKPWVVIETVGVGQVEVEIADAADTTIVVVNPGWGDAVQANKAGLMEIADIFVINKADRPGVDETRRDLEQMLEFSFGSDGVMGDDDGHHRDLDPVLAPIGGHGDGHGVGQGSRGAPDVPAAPRWRPPIIATVASRGEGADDLWAVIGRHRAHLERTGLLEQGRAARLTDELHRILAEQVLQRARDAAATPAFDALRDEVLARTLDPWAAADRLLG